MIGLRKLNRCCKRRCIEGMTSDLVTTSQADYNPLELKPIKPKSTK